MPQQPTLFRGSVADNIRLGVPAATDRDVRAAAARAGADVFIPTLPEGYDTVVGEGGRPLSAGELQRIALARAFLRDAALVILDEPTANLDPASAELVSDAIERLRAGRTVLLIVHRPELAARADRIVHLHEGRIVETRRRRHDRNACAARRLRRRTGPPRSRCRPRSACSPSGSGSG